LGDSRKANENNKKYSRNRRGEWRPPVVKTTIWVSKVSRKLLFFLLIKYRQMVMKVIRAMICGE
jgi:hypothetical protein